VLSGDTILFKTNQNIYIFEISNLIISDVKTSGSSTSGTIRISIHPDVGTAKVNNVRFEGNTVSGTSYATGAAIYIVGGANILIDNCTFIGNKALSSNPTPNITSAAHGGGAIALRTGGNPKLLGNTFIGNHTQGLGNANVAFTGGGALGAGQVGTSATFVANVELAGNVFQDNTTGAGDGDYNDFYLKVTTGAITSGGYNVFKGTAIPSTAIWTKDENDTDAAFNVTGVTFSTASVTLKSDGAPSAFSIGVPSLSENDTRLAVMVLFTP
jgi:hypothetical protein